MDSPVVQFLAVVRSPVAGWGSVFREGARTIEGLYRGFLVPVALVPSVSAFLGLLVFEGRFFSAVYAALVAFFLHLLVVPVGAVVVRRIGAVWEEEVGFLDAAYLVAFVLGPSALAGIAGVFPVEAWSGVVLRFLGYGFSLSLLITGAREVVRSERGVVRWMIGGGVLLVWAVFKNLFFSLVPFYHS
jgi:hypothetical protein